jgi:transcriptional regulator with XRE-family HTH domain
MDGLSHGYCLLSIAKTGKKIDNTYGRWREEFLVSTTLGAFVRARRQEYGWSQSELAERLGWNQPDVSWLENDRTSFPQPDRFLALARVLNIEPGALLEHVGYRGSSWRFDGDGREDAFRSPERRELVEIVARLRDADVKALLKFARLMAKQ